MWRAIVQFIRDVRQAIERWFADDGPLMAAATAYYLGLSFFPLLWVLIAGLGWFLQHTHLGHDAQEEVLTAIAQNVSPTLKDYVADSLKVVQDRSIINGPIGLATVLITALAAFAQLDSAMDRIAGQPVGQSKSMLAHALALVVQRGRAFLMLLALGAVIVLVFLTGIVVAAVEAQTTAIVPLGGWFSDALQIAVALAINAAVFTLLFRLLPKSPAGWADCFYGGLLTAAAWEIGRQLLNIFIARSRYTSAYGVVGAFLAVLLWCYYAISIILIGAEYIQVLRNRTEQPSSGNNI
ncbi:MAG TPA: YihY/virulence factor BrkB family protein [Pirellulales bacterium]|nr:YihY/virulence factor BrkB family protein [Pirellulales bacterium]